MFKYYIFNKILLSLYTIEHTISQSTRHLFMLFKIKVHSNKPRLFYLFTYILVKNANMYSQNYFEINYSVHRNCLNTISNFGMKPI